MKSYKVLNADWFNGLWIEAGETVELTDRQAKYPLMGGTIELSEVSGRKAKVKK